jgi:hypothetical protein
MHAKTVGTKKIAKASMQKEEVILCTNAKRGGNTCTNAKSFNAEKRRLNLHKLQSFRCKKRRLNLHEFKASDAKRGG